MIITSKDNTLIKRVRKLQHKKFRDETGMFILEGERSVQEGLQAGRVTDVFIKQNAVAAEKFKLHSSYDHVFYHFVEDEAFLTMAETDTPPPVLALAQQNREDAWQKAMQGNFLVYLDRIADPGNVGTIMRSVLAFSGDALLLAPGSADPYSAKSVRSSCGAILHLPVVPEVTVGKLQELKTSGFQLTAADAAAETSYFDYDFRGRQILLIGNEANGLTSELKRISCNSIKIPINDRSESLNAALSCAIILAEAKRQSFKR